MITADIIYLLSVLLTLQGLLSLYWMLYAWEDVERVTTDKSPASFVCPHYSFTAIIPARNEKRVITATLNAITNIAYPADLMEIIVVCRKDDPETISEVQKFQTPFHYKGPEIKLIVCSDYPINKPHSLNWGLRYATKEIVGIFDAEDQPHREIYSVINTVLVSENADVIQSGVQLMNYNSNWFSTLNVLEYFFWFKSALHFFSKRGVIPLGGNTVFFKKEWLQKVGGWDEDCLTEDVDVGIRLNASGARIKVVYDEKYTTREETPPTLKSFIKQRTRWNQGFMQIFFKGEWLKIPGISRKVLTAYMLLLPEIQAFMFILIPVSAVFTIAIKLPPGLALFSLIPLLVLILQISTTIVGLYEFTKDYKLPFSWVMPIKVFMTFWFYLGVLGFSSVRAVGRVLIRQVNWEKTRHINAHRIALEEEVSK